MLSRDPRRNQMGFKPEEAHSPALPSFLHTEIKASSPAARLWALPKGARAPLKTGGYRLGAERCKVSVKHLSKLLKTLQVGSKDLRAEMKRLPRASNIRQC